MQNPHNGANTPFGIIVNAKSIKEMNRMRNMILADAMSRGYIIPQALDFDGDEQHIILAKDEVEKSTRGKGRFGIEDIAKFYSEKRRS